MLLRTPAILTLAIIGLAPSVALADIFRWTDGELIPGTAGIEPRPGVNLKGLGLDYASFKDADLSDAAFNSAKLNHADLSNADLTNATLSFADLTDANFSGAVVMGAEFGDPTLHGFTKEQLYSTSSYQRKTL